MASKYWIKLYHEILDDPKMGLMPDRLWRRTIELFLIAGEFDQGGDLPTVEEIAYRLHLGKEETLDDLNYLLAEKIVVKRETGRWAVRKFEERQSALSSTQRSRYYRKSQREKEYYGDENKYATEAGRNVANSATIRPIDKIRLDKIRIDKNSGTKRCNNGDETLQDGDDIEEKENQLINDFCSIAKIPFPFQMKTQSEWISQVGEWIDLGVTREDIEKAVEYADKNNFSIARPASITNLIKADLSYRKRNNGKDRIQAGEVFYGPDGEEILIGGE